MFFRPVFFMALSISFQVHSLDQEDLTRQKEKSQFYRQN